jgi:hypothetical protein
MRKLTIVSLILSLAFIACKDEKAEPKVQAASTLTPQEQKMVENTKLLFKAWNEKDTNSLSGFMVDNYVHKTNGKVTSTDRAGFVALMRSFFTASPDVNFTNDIDVKGNKVYAKWVGKGTLTGMLGTQQLSGKTFEVDGLSVYRFNDEGKLTEEDGYFDQLSYLEPAGYTLTAPKGK